MSEPDKRAAKARKNVPPQGGRLIATADNDITIAFWNDVLPLQDPTIDAKAPHLGLKLYDEVLRDGRARSALNKRISKVTRREWEVEPASGEHSDVAAADLCRAVLKTIGFDKLTGDLLGAKLKGFAIAELLWGRNADGFIVPIGFKDHDQSRFVFDTDWQPRLLTRENPTEGIELPKRKFIVHRHEAKANNPYGFGLGATLYWHVLFKREGVAFWMVFLDKFASPTPVGKYPQGTADTEVLALVETLKRMVQAGALAVPLGTEVSYLEASRAGEAGYEKWVRYWDEQTAEVVNGETLSTNLRGEGSRAAAETHSEEGHGIADGDADDLSATLNETLLAWITEANFPNARPPTVWRRRPKNIAKEEEQKTRKVERQKKVLELLARMKVAGFQPKDLPAWLEDQMEVPLEEIDAELVAAARAQIAPPTAPPPSPDQASQFADDDDAIGHLTDQLLAQGDPGFEKLMGRARTAFADADSYEDLSARLLALTEDRDHDGFTSNLGDAVALADLIGRGEVYDVTGIHTGGSKKKRLKRAAFADEPPKRPYNRVTPLEPAAEPVGPWPRADAPKPRRAANPRKATPFAEALEFQRGKIRLPTDRYSDLIEVGHNRAFVVAGVRDDALLADLQSAVDDAIARGMPFNGWTDKDGTYREGFRDRFDQIVARHGWDHSMSAERRARVIYETNLATARAAGRVAQATDPAVRKAFPYWQYHHAHTRVPANPRERHEQWDGLILSVDDKFWKTHTPPNGWRCSCGFTTLTAAKLKRLGKDAPDPSPAIGMRPIIDPSTGKLIEYPEGVDFGFAYQPGQDWSHGLAPKPLAGKPQDYRQLTLPTPKPPALPTGRAFKAPLLDETKIDDGEAITRFLRSFGPMVEGAVLFRDKAGQAIALSPQIFTRPDGSLKLAADRKRSLERLAETIIDPDEIWVRWEQNRKTGRWHLVRHYLRAAEGKGIFSVFRFGADGWDGVTAFPARPNYLDRYRTGRLLYRHEG